MKSIKKTICLVLCLGLLMSFCSCGNNAHPIKLDLGPSRNEDAVALYKTACADVSASKHWKLNIVSTKTITSSGNFYKESYVQSLAYENYGKDSMRAHSSMIYTSGNSRIHQEEFYQNSTLYTSINNKRFYGAITQDRFRDRFTPAILFSDENYQSVHLKSTANGAQITFGDALTPEHWYNIDADMLNSASGYVLLDTNGRLTESSYSISYTYGETMIHESITTHFSTIQPNSVKRVDSPESYIHVDHPQAPARLEFAAGLLAQTNSVHSLIQETSISQAAGMHYNYTTQVQMNDAYTTLQADISYESTLIDYSRDGERVTKYQSEQFYNGEYSYKDPDGNLQTDTSVTDSAMKEHILNLLIQNIAMPEHILSANTSFTETAETITFTLDEEIAQRLKQYACQTLSVDPALMDSLAQSYSTKTACGALTLDTTTGLPSELIIQYVGEHIIEDQAYLLTYELKQSFFLVNPY